MSEDLIGQILGALVNRDGNNNGLGGGDGALWLIIILVLFGGWGNRGYGNQGGGYGANGVGGNELYPWMSQGQQISNGFAAAATQLCNCCSDMQMAMASGFAGVEANANARQIANMQQGFGMQTAMMQGFNAAQAQTSQFAYDTGLAMANQTATILAEHCSDRQAFSDGVRDIIANQVAVGQRQIDNQNAGIQSIMDKLCQLELDGYKRQVSDRDDTIAQLRAQLNTANFAASQQAQNAYIQQGFANEVDALYNRLSNCPVPSMPVYGRTPIFTCQGQNPCPCNG